MTNEQLIPVGIAIAAGASVYGLDWMWRWMFSGSERKRMKALAKCVDGTRIYSQQIQMKQSDWKITTMAEWESVVDNYRKGWEQPKEK